MANKLKKPTSDFTLVGNAIFRKTKKMKVIGLYTFILNLPDNWNFSLGGLAAVLDDGIDAIRGSVQKLEELGFIKRTQSKDENGNFDGYDWEIFYEPSLENPSSENPTTEKPMTGKPTTEKPSSENQRQLDTELIQELNIQELINSSKKVSNNTKSRTPARAYARESYEELMIRLGFGSLLRQKVFEFIQFLQLNGTVLTNKQLEEMLFLVELKARDAIGISSLEEGRGEHEKEIEEYIALSVQQALDSRNTKLIAVKNYITVAEAEAEAEADIKAWGLLGTKANKNN